MMEPVIVICDDEVDLLSELAEWFECNGWTVRTARTVGEALAQMCHGPITCLITDRWTANGDDLLRRVDAMPASRRPGLVAMMTGDIEVEVRPCPPGADLFFLKPVDPGSMLEAISARLAARRGASPSGGHS